MDIWFKRPGCSQRCLLGGGVGVNYTKVMLFTEMFAGDFLLLRASLGASHTAFCKKILLIASPFSSSSGDDSTGTTSSFPMPIIILNPKCNNNVKNYDFSV